jgi:stage V sporulation protein S
MSGVVGEVTVTIDVLKVSSKSNPNSVAGALAGVARSYGSVEIQVVGAGALNQAIKAIAIARGYMATSGQDLMCRPTFADIRIDGESRTAIRLQVEACEIRPAPAAASSAPAAATASAASAPSGDGSTPGRFAAAPAAEH